MPKVNLENRVLKRQIQTEFISRQNTDYISRVFVLSWLVFVRILRKCLFPERLRLQRHVAR